MLQFVDVFKKTYQNTVSHYKLCIWYVPTQYFKYHNNLLYLDQINANP